MQISQVPSPNASERSKDDKIQFLLLHYTAVSASETMAIFQRPHSKASAHYTILDKPNLEGSLIVQHVDETKVAWHAGVSYWQGVHNINAQSIGIEHVNLGHRWRPDYPTTGCVKVPGWHEEFYPYPEGQIAAAVPLYKKIIKEYDIKPWNIVGHDMVALPYGRKIDPGPLFPWKWLAQEHGIGMWPDKTQKVQDISSDEAQRLLVRIGFHIPDKESLKGAVRAFQMHWRPTKVDGELDEETKKLIKLIDNKIL